MTRFAKKFDDTQSHVSSKLKDYEKNNTCSTADVASQFASCYRSCKLCLAFGSFIRDSFLQWQMFPYMHSKNNSLFLLNS